MIGKLIKEIIKHPKLNYNVNICNIRTLYTSPVASKKAPDPGIQLKERNWQLEFHQIQPKSRLQIYDDKPIKVKIFEGKTYRWCACGYSNTQPFCSGEHAYRQMKITLRPVVFKAPVTKEVWFCTCKLTKNRPFCDGSHRSKEVQDAIKLRNPEKR